jgi:transposase
MISHDAITRFLSEEVKDSKALWLKVKKLVRQYENEEACIVFDDTVIEKQYMDENDIICWHWDHQEGRSVKGINLLTAFYVTVYEGKMIRIPIGYEIIAKTEKYFDEKENKEKRRSPKTKNEMMCEMISTQIKNRVQFRYVLADSWFSSVENMKFINKKNKTFIFEMKENRMAATSEADKKEGRFERRDRIRIPGKQPTAVWLKECPVPVTLHRQVFKNKDGSVGIRFLVTNDLEMSKGPIETLYKKRWGVEEYHKRLKQNASIVKSQDHTDRTQSNHIFSAIYAYIKLEKIKLERRINHFALKMLIYTESLKTAMEIMPGYSY